MINTECRFRIDHFGEDRNYSSQVFLLYDNLHYEPRKSPMPTKIRFDAFFVSSSLPSAIRRRPTNEISSSRRRNFANARRTSRRLFLFLLSSRLKSEINERQIFFFGQISLLIASLRFRSFSTLHCRRTAKKRLML